MKLLSPCHGKPIFIGGYDLEDPTIWCSEDKCYNTWDKNGDPE